MLIPGALDQRSRRRSADCYRLWSGDVSCRRSARTRNINSRRQAMNALYDENDALGDCKVDYVLNVNLIMPLNFKLYCISKYYNTNNFSYSAVSLHICLDIFNCVDIINVTFKT